MRTKMNKFATTNKPTGAFFEFPGHPATEIQELSSPEGHEVQHTNAIQSRKGLTKRAPRDGEEVFLNSEQGHKRRMCGNGSARE
jgi:hypothetical protein